MNPRSLRPPPAWTLALAALAFSVAGCGALASSPAWVGGGMEAVTPEREAQEDAKVEHERVAAAKQPLRIGAKHILVMHKDSKSKPEGVTRTRDEARKRAQECLVKLRGGANFDPLVAQYSDEPGSADRAGDLGVFDRGSMVKEFADAAFGLKVGEVSEVVESPFGFHIIQRTE